MLSRLTAGSIENLSEEAQRGLIKEQSKIYTACADGKIPWISADDIAAVGFRALTDEKSHNTDYRILGPELLTYDDVWNQFFFFVVSSLTIWSQC